MESFLLKFEKWVKTAGSGDLDAIVEIVRAEQYERALSSGDLDAVIEEAFKEGFDTAGYALDPYIKEGVVVVPGAKLNKSMSNHRCRFGVVAESSGQDGEWIWESELLVRDELRYLVNNTGMQSVSLVTPLEGLEIDMIASNFRSGQHQFQNASSWKVEDGKLVAVRTRTRNVKESSR